MRKPSSITIGDVSLLTYALGLSCLRVERVAEYDVDNLSLATLTDPSWAGPLGRDVTRSDLIQKITALSAAANLIWKPACRLT